MKHIPIVLVLFLIGPPLNAQEIAKLNSLAYDWTDLPVEQTNSGERRPVFEGHTNTLGYFEMHVTTLEPGNSPHAPHVHEDLEELVIVKEGQILQSINQQKSVLGPGSVVLISPGDSHGLSNAGNTNATYYVIRWKGQASPDMGRSGEGGGSRMYDWEKIESRETEKGFHRQFMRRPTANLEELEMHVTTLKEGISSHGEHVHSDEEMVIVIRGNVEKSIDGKKYKLGPGSIMLLTDSIPHGIRNDGKGECEYFAFRWK